MGDELASADEIGALPPRTPRVPDAIRAAAAKPRFWRLVATGAVIGTSIAGTLVWSAAARDAERDAAERRAGARTASTLAAIAPAPTQDDPIHARPDSEPDVGGLPPRHARVPDAPRPASLAEHAPPDVPRGRSGPPRAERPGTATATSAAPRTEPTHGSDDRLSGCVTAGDSRCVVELLGDGRARTTAQRRVLFDAQRALGLLADPCASARQLQTASGVTDAQRAAYATYVDTQCGAPAMPDQP